MDMQVHFHDFVLYLMLFPLYFGRNIRFLLLEQSLFNVIGRNDQRLSQFIVLRNLIDQGRFTEGIRRLEGMQLVELHRIQPEHLIDDRLQRKRAVIFLS